MFGVGEAVGTDRLADFSVVDFLQAVGKRSIESKKTKRDKYLFMLVARVELKVEDVQGTADKINNDN